MNCVEARMIQKTCTLRNEQEDGSKGEKTRDSMKHRYRIVDARQLLEKNILLIDAFSAIQCTLFTLFGKEKKKTGNWIFNW